MNNYTIIYSAVALFIFLIVIPFFHCEDFFCSAVIIGDGTCACVQGYNQQSCGPSGTEGKDKNDEYHTCCETNTTSEEEASPSTSFESKPLSSEEPGTACQEDPMLSSEEVSPDQKNESDKGTLSDQDKARLISVLKKVKELPENYVMDTQQVHDILQALEPIGKPNGKMLMDALREQDPSTFVELLPGVVVLDQIIRLSEPAKQETDIPENEDDENAHGTKQKAPALAIQGLPLELLLSVVKLFTNDSVFRWIIGFMHIMYSDTPYIYDTLRDLTGCSVKRVYEGQKDVEEYGFLLDLDRLHNPGAGNIGIVALFREKLLPMAISVGLSMEEVLHRAQLSDAGYALEAATEGIDIQADEATPEAAQAGTGKSDENNEAPEKEENSQNEPSPVNTGEASGKCNTVEFEASCYTIDKVQESLMILRERAGKVLQRMDDEINKRDSSCSIVLELNRKEFNEALVHLDEHYNTLLEAKGTLSEAQMSLMCNVLLMLIAKVRNLLEVAWRVFETCDKNEAMSKPYYAYKEMRRMLSHSRLEKELGMLWPIFRQYMTLVLEENGKKQQSSTEKVAPSSTSDMLSGTLNVLNTLLEKINDATKMRQKQAKCIPDAKFRLHEMRQLLENLKKQKIENESSQEAYCTLFLLMTIRLRVDMCLKEWEKGTPDYTAARNACALFVQGGFIKNLQTRVAECLLCFENEILKDTGFEKTSSRRDMPAGEGKAGVLLTPEDFTGSTDNPVTENEESDCAQEPTIKDMLNEAKKNAEEWTGVLRGTIESLLGCLESVPENGKSKRGRKKKAGSTADESGQPNPPGNNQPLNDDELGLIMSATEILSSFLSDIKMKVDSISDEASITGWIAVADMASYINNKLKKHLDQKIDTEKGSMLSYSSAMIACRFITGPRFKSRIKDYLDGLEKFSEKDSWQEGSSTPESYVPVNLNTPSQKWFVDDEQILPLDERASLIRKLYEEGKDPTDIRVWLEYIMSQVSSETFGTPTGEGVFCKLTDIEFSRALRYLTGLHFSASALMRLIREDMKCHNRQAAKVDQIGKPHPLRDVQYNFIDACKNFLGLSNTLIISVDTKAMILLGRLKHDNVKILCGPNMKHYKVNDHDFANTMSDIYPEGTGLVDQERMSENAVIKPVGVYCLNDGTGYISLVLGKDTAESMCNLIRSVIRVKREKMPDLKKVLILADGGGANMANGIAWQSELLELADKEQVILHICHYSCGTSKHNPIEHKLFGPISLHWRGKPFLDIEHVASCISGTSLHNSPANRVTCWFDRKRYLTNTEKKAAGQMVLTRKMLDEKAGDRIYHPFSPETDMFKWNYIIYPTGKVPETHDIPEFEYEIMPTEA